MHIVRGVSMIDKHLHTVTVVWAITGYNKSSDNLYYRMAFNEKTFQYRNDTMQLYSHEIKILSH